jgi:hypothetical protein
MKYLILIISILVSITACSKIKNIENENPPQEKFVEAETRENYIINKEGITIGERYPTPEGYTRNEVGKNSFGEFLRNQKLKPYGEKALFYNGRVKLFYDNTGRGRAFYYDGRQKKSSEVYDSVLDVDVGDRDLHQCADAVMLLRAEHLYSQGRYNEIRFNFVSGFKADYKKWMEGYRIYVTRNRASYYKATDPSNSYESFRNYMDMVMAYSGTISLEKELESVNIEDMEIGDVFIVGGEPGHAIIIMDMAVNEDGEKLFLLAQSSMPAQQTQILINPLDKSISPWYSLKGKEKLITPQWKFELDQLKRF